MTATPLTPGLIATFESDDMSLEMETTSSPLSSSCLLAACCLVLAATGCASTGATLPTPTKAPSVASLAAENRGNGQGPGPTAADFADRLPPLPGDLQPPAAAAWRALSSGELSRARRELEAVAAEDSPQAGDAIVRGYLAWAGGDLERARRRFEASSSRRPSDAALALYGLGLVSEAEGDRQEAIRHYGDALDADPRMMAAAVALQMAELEEAKEVLLQVRPNDHEAGFAEAGNGHATRPPPPAEEAYRRAIELAPELLPPHLELAALYERRGDAAAAVSVLERARRHNGDHPELLRELAWAQQATGDTKRALTTLRRLREVVPDDAHLDARIAETQRRAHREGIPESIHRLEKAPTVRRDELAALLAARLRALEDVSGPAGNGTVIVDIDGNPLAPYIHAVVQLGIMEVFGDHGFAPDLEVSRGMLAPIAYRVLELFQANDPASSPSIADLHSQHASAPEIRAVVGQDIMKLDRSRRFRTLEKVTGEEAVRVITRLGQTIHRTLASRLPQR